MSSDTVMYTVDTQDRYLKLVVLSGSPFSKGCICEVFVQDLSNKNWELLGEAIISEKVKQGTKFSVSNQEVVLSHIFVQQF